LSLSTHNNISFAKGSDKEWTLLLQGDDSSFFTLYNAIGATVTLTERFGVNAEIGNIFSKTDRTGVASDTDYDTVWGQAKLISSVTENVEFTAGLRVDFTTQTGTDDSTVFSVPVGIGISF
jgi:outer membrane receptor protein involved in Fe transport